jgi:hypothetical protein
MTTMHRYLQLMEEEHCYAGLFAVVAIAPLPLLRWPLCCCCNGAIAIVAQVPLPLLCQHCCPCCAAIVTFLHWHCHPLCHASVVTHFILLVLWLSLQWCCYCCADFFIFVALASLPLLRWHCCHLSTGIVTLIVLELLSDPVPQHTTISHRKMGWGRRGGRQQRGRL